jgi:archaellum component FlaC
MDAGKEGTKDDGVARRWFPEDELATSADARDATNASNRRLAWMVNVVADLYTMRTQEVETGIESTLQALNLLNNLDSHGADLAKELELIEPEINKLKAEEEQLNELMAKQKEEVNQLQSTATDLERTWNTKAAQADILRDELNATVSQGVPIMKEGETKLENLDKALIKGATAIKKPSVGLKKAFSAVCILMSVKPGKSKDVLQGYWSATCGKQVLGDAKITRKILNIPKDRLKDDVADKINEVLNDDDCNPPEKLHEECPAAVIFLQFVAALMKYRDMQIKVVGPSRDRLSAAESEADAAQQVYDAEAAKKNAADTALSKTIERLRQLREDNTRLGARLKDGRGAQERATKVLEVLGQRRAMGSESDGA